MSLQRHLREAWADHAIVGINNLTIIDSSAGSWPSDRERAGSSQCASPAFWIFLAGHYRTFAWTHPFTARVAELSSPCTFVLGFMPADVDVPVQHANPKTGFVQRKPLLNAMSNSPFKGRVPALLRHAASTTFNRVGAPAFAYAVFRRSGLVEHYPACLPLYWHGVWAVARWAARHHGFTPDASSVVLRARPDVLLTRPFDIRGLERYFAAGRHGRHLALAQNVQRCKRTWCTNVAQSDLSAFFSFGSYTSDVARPLEKAGERGLSSAEARLWWQRGVASGWAMGRSDDPWTWSPERSLNSGERWMYGWHTTPSVLGAANAVSQLEARLENDTALLVRCANRCLCLDGDDLTHCRSPSCLVTVAESVVTFTEACKFDAVDGSLVNHTSCLLRAPPARPGIEEAHRQAPPLLGPLADLTERVTCYCAGSSTDQPSERRPLFECSAPQRNVSGCPHRSVWHYHWRCSRSVSLLPESTQSSPLVWPPKGCGGSAGGYELAKASECAARSRRADM